MSDHISGPRALAEPIADITDFYAFPGPERPGHLVLVMNTVPFAKPSELCSDALIYRFRLRPVSLAARSEPVPFTVGAREFSFDVVFSAPVNGTHGGGAAQEGTCTTPGRRDGLLHSERRGGPPVLRRAPVRRPALGSVHDGGALALRGSPRPRGRHRRLQRRPRPELLRSRLLISSTASYHR